MGFFPRVCAAVAAALLVVCAATSANSQTVIPNPSWVQLSPAASPPGRDDAAAAFDVAHGVMVLFGGFSLSAGHLGDTWVFDGKNWTQKFPAHSPSARHAAVMVYDAVHSKCVLFGGADSNFNLLGDTWTWNGTDWTQLSPAHSPSARDYSTMAFDSIGGQTVLFGGYVGGFYPNPLVANDTWTWNGTDWTQLSPAHSPSARQQAAMAFDPLSGQILLFGGVDGTGTVGDTWTFGPATSSAAAINSGNSPESNSDWTQKTPATSPPARTQAAMTTLRVSEGTWKEDVNLIGDLLLFVTGGLDDVGNPLGDNWYWDDDKQTWYQLHPETDPSERMGAAMVFDPERGEVTLFGGSRDLFDTWILGSSGHAGTTSVCPTGQTNLAVSGSFTTASTCGQTATIPFEFITGGTIGQPGVATLGATGQDFTDAGTGTCTTNGTSHVYNAGDICTVDVKFAPKYAGPRYGAAVLKDSSGNIISTTLLSGTGVAPQAVFAPVTIGAVGGGFSNPVGIAVDAAGNVFVADSSNSLVKEAPSGCTSSTCTTAIGGGFNAPYGVAVDGAGDVYVADTGNDAVKMIPPGCATSACVITLGGGFLHPDSVAVDGFGTVFVADSYNNAVKQMPPGCASSVCVTKMGGGFSEPTGVATDGNGYVYVADYNNNAIKQLRTVCMSAACVTTKGGGFSSPAGVSADGRGNIYVADFGNGAVKKLRANCASSGCVTTLGSGFSNPIALAGDGAGNVYVADTFINAVKVIRRTSPTNLFFTSTVVGSTSTDSPRKLTVGNAGNVALKISKVSYPVDFPKASGVTTDCPSSANLAPGSTCTVSVDFSPLASSATSLTTALKEAVTIADNSLNVSSGSQSFTAAGSATFNAPALTAPAPSKPLGGSSATFTWSPGSATSFRLVLGSAQGLSDIYDSGQTTATSESVSAIPTGETVYARLYFLVGSNWKYVEYTYPQTTPSIMSPAPGSTLPGSTATFTWNPGIYATFQLHLGTTAGSNNIYFSGNTTGTSVTASNLPTNGETIHARLSWLVSGVWQHIDYTYTAQ